ncbi:MAG: type II toxin-antitoxin system HicB family antitoxin [Treponematales bacterium]
MDFKERMTKTYIALFEYEPRKTGFSVVFPDLPGLITAGSTYDDTVRMASEGLASHINFLLEEGEEVPEPRTLEQIEETWENWRKWKGNYTFMVVPIALLPITAGTAHREISRAADNRTFEDTFV